MEACLTLWEYAEYVRQKPAQLDRLVENARTQIAKTK